MIAVGDFYICFVGLFVFYIFFFVLKWEMQYVSSFLFRHGAPGGACGAMPLFPVFTLAFRAAVVCAAWAFAHSLIDSAARSADVSHVLVGAYRENTLFQHRRRQGRVDDLVEAEEGGDRCFHEVFHHGLCVWGKQATRCLHDRYEVFVGVRM